MSLVAEFAQKLQTQEQGGSKSTSEAGYYEGRIDILRGAEAAVFDIYGTLVDYWSSRFADSDEKQKYLLTVFRKTADYFGFTETLQKIDPDKSPEETLSNFYHGLILMKHEELQSRGKNFPEVQIEQIWNVILSILGNNGYIFDTDTYQSNEEGAKCIAYYYNFFALDRGFFEGVVDALIALKKSGIKLGIVSNAQFYTPIDLSLFVREQSEQLVDYLELFDADLCFFSYDYSVAKPNPLLFTKLLDALKELEILPENTVFVGNDLVQDIAAAQELGMKTALFTGNEGSLFLHDKSGEVTPDIVFSSFNELPQKLQFHSGKAGN